MQKLANAITELKKCRVDLFEKNRVIDDKLTRFDGAAGPAFWQEPSFVWGGIIVSASVSSLVTAYVIHSRQK